MAIYDTPTNNDTRGIYEFFNFVNNTADGLFFPIILLVIWVVVFVASKQFTTSRAWTIASFVGAALSIPLVILGLVNPRYMYLLIFLFAIGAVWLKLETRAV